MDKSWGKTAMLRLAGTVATPDTLWQCKMNLRVCVCDWWSVRKWDLPLRMCFWTETICVFVPLCVSPFFFLCCCLLRPLVRFTFLYKVCWLVQHWPKEQSTKRRAVTLFWHPTPNWQTEHGIRGSERQYERRGGKKRGKDKQKGENGVWKNKLQTPSAVHFKKRCHFLSSSTASESCTLIGDKQILKTALSSPSLSYC